MSISDFLFEQAKIYAKEYSEGKPLTIPTENQLRDILQNPQTYKDKGEKI